MSEQSGYTSGEEPKSQGLLSYIQSHINTLLPPTDVERSNANASPDLGIESDQGRFSSMEANINVIRPLLPTLELTQSMSDLLDRAKDPSCSTYFINKWYYGKLFFSFAASDMCVQKSKEVTTENMELRKRLLRTRRALEDTVSQLTLANRRKKEVEKTICKQIHKTSQVLRKAKANLDSGSETDHSHKLN